MDRCISRQETPPCPATRLQLDDTPSPWNRFNVANSSSFTVRRRSASPNVAALSPLSSPSSFYGDDLLGSPDPGDNVNPENPVETLSSLYINDSLRSRRSLGSNASSNRSSSSSGSTSSWTQQLPSFHRPLKFVSRPPDLPFAAVPTQASPDKPADGEVRRRNRRNPSIVVEDADKAAFEQLVGQRRVRKSFLFGKRNANSRQAINKILTTPADDQQKSEDQNSDLSWDEQPGPGLPPVDYAHKTVSARSAEGWQVAARLQALGVLPKEEKGLEPDDRASPVDVEMSSKPPSRESSFRGDEEAIPEAAVGATGNTIQEGSTAAQAPAQVKSESSSGESVSVGTGATAPAAKSVDSKKRIYGCTVPDCGKVYTKSSHLKSHMRSHTGK